MSILSNLNRFFYLFTVCFKIFDADKDGELNIEEMNTMLNCMIEVRNQTLPVTERQNPNVEQMINEILNNGKVGLSIEDYLVWVSKNKELPGNFKTYFEKNIVKMPR